MRRRHRPHRMTRRGLLVRAVIWGGAAATWARAFVGDRAATDAAPPSGRGHWLTKEPLSVARAEVGVATVNGNVYVLGGYAGGRVDQPFNQEYDVASNLW